MRCRQGRPTGCGGGARQPGRRAGPARRGGARRRRRAPGLKPRIFADGRGGPDRSGIDALAQGLGGSGGALLIASGTLGLAPGRTGSERDRPDPTVHPRVANAAHTLALAERGLRSMVVRFAPTVHWRGRRPWVRRHPGAHRARDGCVGLYRRRREPVARGAPTGRRPAGAPGHRAGRCGDGAACRGRAGHCHARYRCRARRVLDLPVASVAAERAAQHFAWLGPFFNADAPASSALTCEVLGWWPNHPTLAQDIAAGHYPGR